MQISALTLESYTVDSMSNIIEWDIKTTETLNNVSFALYVSESPEGEWRQLGLFNNKTYSFIDDTFPKFQSKWTIFYYKLDVLQGTKVVKTIINELFLNINPILKEMRRRVTELNVSTRYGGTECLVYKIKTYGQRCVCYDLLSKQSKVLNCPQCGGTTIVRGIYTPIKSSCLILNQNAIESVATDTGTVEADSDAVLLPHYPLVRPGDLLYLKQVGRLYNINNINTIEYKMDVVKQICQISVEDKGSTAWQYILNQNQIT